MSALPRELLELQNVETLVVGPTPLTGTTTLRASPVALGGRLFRDRTQSTAGTTSARDRGAGHTFGVHARSSPVRPDDAPLEQDPSAVFPTVGGALAKARFWKVLCGITAGGLVIRVVYVMAVTRFENSTLYDSFWYGVTSNELSQGQFFRTPFGTGQTAAHPPLTSLLLGAASFVIGRHRGTTAQRLVMAFLGAVVVLLVGMVGRNVAGPWVGLVAAGLAAVVPDFWIPSGIIMSETPSMLVMALILLAVVRVIRSPTTWNAGLLGLACGAEALVRAELILFVPALLVPGVFAARSVPLSRRFALLGIGLLGVVLVIGPWVGRNLATFQDATYLSTGNGLVLAGSNCSRTYSGGGLGSWSLPCALGVGSTGDESVQSARGTHLGLEYAEHHVGRLPVVVLARVGRLWDFFDPVQEAQIETHEGRPLAASLAGLSVYYLMVPLGIAGVVIYRRRGIRQWFLLMPAGVLTLVAVVAYGLIRFRDPFEVCLAVLAAPPLVLMGQALGRRSSRDPRPLGHEAPATVEAPPPAPAPG
jgi:4-amino-4-deoxy-L-arabinose transferase-like glycosyltransferase